MPKHKKRGRPLSSPLVRDNLVGIRLNKKELQALSLYCWRYETSLSETIRDALQILCVIPENKPARTGS